MASRGPGTGKARSTARPGARTSSARRSPKPAASARSAKAPDRPRSAPAAAGSRTATKARATRQDEGSGLWRWGVIALVGIVLVVLLAPTVRSYFAQRSEIAALERQVVQGEERVAQLQAERERWEDPVYVEQQARERLKFVRPGEVSYTVIGADELEEQTVASGAVSDTRPWYDRMWASIAQADRTDTEFVP
jgi:cell division protein FtsB